MWRSRSSCAASRASEASRRWCAQSLPRPFQRWFRTVPPVAAPVPNLNVMFGSQTGTAMGFAKQLGKLARKENIKAKVLDLEEFDPEAMLANPSEIYVFVQATFGQGEGTDNAKQFFDWLKKQNTADQSKFSPLRFAVFGLGMSQTYPARYQAAAKWIEQRMLELGAQEIVDRGEGDDNGDIENDFQTWVDDKLFPKLAQFDVEESAESKRGRPCLAPSVEEKPFTLKVLAPGVAKDVKLFETRPFDKSRAIDIRNPYPAPLLRKLELHSKTSPGSCKHIELDFSDAPNFSYVTGDYLGVFPRNHPELVSQYAKTLGLPLDTVLDFQIQPNATVTSLPFTTPCTLETYLSQYADLSGPLKKSLLSNLLPFVIRPAEKEQLAAVIADNAAVKSMVEEEQILLDVMQRYPSMAVPLTGFIELVPPLQPRYYSISSSDRVHPHTVHLTVGLTKHTTRAGRIHYGVSSNFLCNELDVGQKVPVFVKQSLFKLPDSTHPIVMIAAGTGLAPFRAFLQDRTFLRERDNKLPGCTVLYYGCYHQNEDFLYHDEMQKEIERGNLELVPAFSHDQEERIFVQHKLLQNAERIWNLIHHQGAYLYVCGATRMAAGVESTLVEIAEKCGKMERPVAEQYIRTLKEKNHYQEDKFG